MKPTAATIPKPRVVCDHAVDQRYTTATLTVQATCPVYHHVSRHHAVLECRAARNASDGAPPICPPIVRNHTVPDDRATSPTADAGARIPCHIRRYYAVGYRRFIITEDTATVPPGKITRDDTVDDHRFSAARNTTGPIGSHVAREDRVGDEHVATAHKGASAAGSVLQEHAAENRRSCGQMSLMTL